MLLLAASCHYGCDEFGMPVPESAKYPDASALVEGLALVLRHMGQETATVRPPDTVHDPLVCHAVATGAAGAGCAVCSHAAAGVYSDCGKSQEHCEHGLGLSEAGRHTSGAVACHRCWGKRG